MMYVEQSYSRHSNIFEIIHNPDNETFSGTTVYGIDFVSILFVTVSEQLERKRQKEILA